jgi:hypothetical protein
MGISFGGVLAATAVAVGIAFFEVGVFSVVLCRLGCVLLGSLPPALALQLLSMWFCLLSCWPSKWTSVH